MNRMLVALGTTFGLGILSTVAAVRAESPLAILNPSTQPVADSFSPENTFSSLEPLTLRLLDARQQFALLGGNTQRNGQDRIASGGTSKSGDVAADDIANGAPTEASRRLNRSSDGTTRTPDLAPGMSDLSEVATEHDRSTSFVLSPETEQRLMKARRVLEVYRPKMLNTREHGPWETMHAIVAYGVDTQVRQDGPSGAPVTAIGWLAFNNPAAGQRLFYARREGGVGALTGPGLQGHAGQFLAIMAQSRLERTYPIYADGKKFTIEDLIKYEQDTCEPKSELTFKLISLAHYLDSDASWTDQNGQTWNIQRLIREELAQPINGVACGGTHRLFGLSYAVFQRAKQGKPMVGEFARAKKFIHDYHSYTYALQNSDGSFSTNWFKGREARQDLDRRLQTTGHILEWMVFSTPRDELQNPRIAKAVDYLTEIMLANPSHAWPIGPRGHALHALAIYEARLGNTAHGVIAPVASAAATQE